MDILMMKICGNYYVILLINKNKINEIDEMFIYKNSFLFEKIVFI